MLTESTYGLPRPRPVYQPGGATDGSLSDVVASAVFDLDATQAASYTSGTTWANLVTAPADGAAQTDYDFRRGDGSTATTYPTFNGTPGDPAAYWSFDGGDRFDLLSGTNTPFLNALHKTTGGTAWWLALTFNKSDGSWTNASLFNTGLSGSPPDFKGIDIVQSASEVVSLLQGDGSVAAIGNTASQTSGNFVVIISYDGSGNWRNWVNTVTATTAAIAFNTVTTDTNAPARIGARSNLTLPLNSETRIYSVAGGNEYLDNTKAAAIIAALAARHGRSYV